MAEASKQRITSILSRKREAEEALSRLRASATRIPELEDTWLNAIASLPDGKPLADLLRTYSTPIPPEVRDQLAELLNPGDPDIGIGRLVYRPPDGIEVLKGLRLNRSYRAEIDRLKKAGERDASQAAAESVGAKTGMSGRTVHRKIKRLREFFTRLGGSR